jgi:hypothetical protein
MSPTLTNDKTRRRNSPAVLRGHHDRALVSTTVEEFRRLLGTLAPASIARVCTRVEMEALWERHKNVDHGRPRVVVDSETRSLVGFVYSAMRSKPVSACAIAVNHLLEHNHPTLTFARGLVGVFNADLAMCRDAEATTETWRLLALSWVDRAIARFVSFHAHPASEWLQLMQSSTSLTYESRAVRHGIIFWKKNTEARRRFERYVVPFPSAISLRDALFKEKWVRAVVDGKRAMLIAGKNGNVIGILSLEALAIAEEIDSDELPTYAPHVSLLPVQHVMAPNDLALLTAPSGDLYAMTGRGIVFHRSQGQWHYNNLEDVERVLCSLVRTDLAIAVLRTVMDLSYERKGALICVLENDADARTLVPDHGAAVVNAVLRSALCRRDMLKWADRQVIASAATTDGATLLSSDGRLLDVACLISGNFVTRAQELGVQSRTFPGARSTAAWNASLYGTAVKVSEDGPIQIWHHGSLAGSIE